MIGCVLHFFFSSQIPKSQNLNIQSRRCVVRESRVPVALSTWFSSWHSSSSPPPPAAQRWAMPLKHFLAPKHRPPKNSFSTTLACQKSLRCPPASNTRSWNPVKVSTTHNQPQSVPFTTWVHCLMVLFLIIHTIVEHPRPFNPTKSFLDGLKSFNWWSKVTCGKFIYQQHRPTAATVPLKKFQTMRPLRFVCIWWLSYPRTKSFSNKTPRQRRQRLPKRRKKTPPNLQIVPIWLEFPATIEQIVATTVIVFETGWGLYWTINTYSLVPMQARVNINSCITLWSHTLNPTVLLPQATFK